MITPSQKSNFNIHHKRSELIIQELVSLDGMAGLIKILEKTSNGVSNGVESWYRTRINSLKSELTEHLKVMRDQIKENI
ncbi:MAG: hypothetical protein ACRC5M_04365 [Anaeroplasmataceae bacterium]